MSDVNDWNRHYCSDCMIKHASLATYHLIYGNQARALAHLHEALREAPYLDRFSLLVIRSGGCTEKAVGTEAEWLLDTALMCRGVESGMDTSEAIAAGKAAITAHWEQRPTDGVRDCNVRPKQCSGEVSQELLRIYIDEMLNGYVETQLALSIGVLSGYEAVGTMRAFRKRLGDAVVAYKAGDDDKLRKALAEVDALFA